MQRGALLYEGKSKRVYAAAEHQDLVVVEFTDQATAFNAKKVAQVSGKGASNCAISAHLFQVVEAAGVRHHLVRSLSKTEMLCHRVEIVPVEVVVRSRAAGSFSKRYGVAEGTVLAEPVVEFFYKSDALDDPLITEDVAVLLGYAKRWELAFLREAAHTVHAALATFWKTRGVDLIDAKYEFGRHDGRLLLADELTPDGARLWDVQTGQRLDKDVFRRDLGDLGESYRGLVARLDG